MDDLGSPFYAAAFRPWWALLVFTALIALPVAAAAEERASPSPAKLSDKWSTKVHLPAYSYPNNDIPSGECRAWIEQGWLVVERRTDQDELEWKIVLAKAVGDEPPQIDASRPGALRVSFRSGRYFIRDEFGEFRCLREPKQPDDVWPRIDLPERDPGELWGSAGGGKMVGKMVKGWFIVAAGPTDGAADCLVRLNHVEMRKGGTMFSGGRVANRITDGDTNLMDDGELLVGQRLENWVAVITLARIDLRKKLPGSPAPKLTGTWLNTGGEELSWNDLKGNAVLLVFFNLGFQPSFTERLPEMKALDEFYDKGLVIVGVHSRSSAEEGEQRVEKAGPKLKFPVLVDEYDTENRYGVEDMPSYFLIDREGKIVWANLPTLPPRAEIEKLLPGKDD
ncbi:MAG TPA: redoxin domain-containing protein [Pirellulales bacterium]|nr:redoxin domain-containing protein [Pirellulales bacterium]